MNKENAIEVKNIKKSYKMYYDKGNLLKERMIFHNRNKYIKRQVLDDISFNVKKGEAIGLIGHNGCGKSTMLKLLTKIIYPDSGSIEMCGRVSSLIELGAGFHPDMSGRENIYINAAIFGLNKKEIDEKIDEIIEFSELEEFIDNPVRTYSSGMYMRLAFAVAINVSADILLIDEILAVGDAGFQIKCFERLQKIKAEGTTIVIVSHSMGQIEQICDRSFWIHEGKIKAMGLPRDVHPQYLEYMSEERKSIADKKKERKISNNVDKGKEEEKKDEKNCKRFGNGNVNIINIVTENSDKETSNFRTGEKMIVKIEYKVNKPVENPIVGIAIVRIDGVHCYGTNTSIDHSQIFDMKEDGMIILEIEEMQLLPGQYVMDVAIQGGTGISVDYWKEAVKFNVYSKNSDVGVARLKHKWLINNGI